MKATLTVSSTAGHPIDVHVYRSPRDESDEYWYVVENSATVHFGSGDLSAITAYSDFKELDMFTASGKIASLDDLVEAVEDRLDMLEEEEREQELRQEMLERQERGYNDEI